jgi:hypothetical protein
LVALDSFEKFEELLEKNTPAEYKIKQKLIFKIKSILKRAFDQENQ